MIEIKYGQPNGLPNPVLAVVGETSTIENELSLFGFYPDNNKTVWLNPKFSPFHIDYIKNLNSDVIISDLASKAYETALSNLPKSNYPDTFKYDMLMDYQNKTFDFCKTSGSSVVGLGCGLGKTPIAIAYAEYLGVNTLVLTKPASIGQWHNEISKFCNSTRIRLDGTQKKRENNWKVALEGNHFTITSYDLMKSKIDADFAKRYLGHNGLLVLDEVCKVKNKDSERSIAIGKIRPYACQAIGLTATPLENNLEEFYNLLNLVSPSYMPNYDQFCSDFLIRVFKTFPHKNSWRRSRGKWVVTGEKNIDKFKELIKPIFIRFEQDEVQDLPPSSIIIREVQLSREQKEMEKILLDISKRDPSRILVNFIFALENIIDPRIINIEKLNIDDSDLYEILEDLTNPKDLSPRLREIEDLIEEIPDQLIIFSRSVKGLKLIRDKIIKEPFSMMTGELSNKAKDETIAEFQSGKNRILLLSEAGEESLNLQQCRNMIIVDKPVNPARLTQLRGRTRRTGQKFETLFYELHSNSVVEARVNQILERKENLADAVLAKEVMA